jgi:transposase
MACPHLQGISAKWANVLLADLEQKQFEQNHFIGDTEREIAALQEHVAQLEKQNAELRARLKATHHRKFKANRELCPSTGSADPNRKGQARKRGAPKGHRPWSRRTPDHVDKTVRVPAPKTCPHCQSAGLRPTGNQQEQLQEDIVLQPQTRVTRFLHDLAFCPSCRREVFATARGELRNCQIGPVTKATAIYLRHELKLSYRDIRKVFDGLFGMPFVPASAMAFDRAAASKGYSLYADLREKIRASDVAYADETHWRIDGRNAYLWYAGNDQVDFFHIDPSRSSDVAVSIFGDDFQGDLVADAYAAYNAINARKRQSCLAHVKTTAKEISDEIRLVPQMNRDRNALRFLNAISDLVREACHIGQRRNHAQITQKQALAFRPRLLRKLKKIGARPLKHDKAESLRQRLLDPKRDLNRLFTFLDVPHMEPTNNRSEQALRLPVIFRKICFGNRSQDGAQTLAELLSFIKTAKRQRRDPRKFLECLLTKDLNAAKAALYGRCTVGQPAYCNSS